MQANQAVAISTSAISAGTQTATTAQVESEQIRVSDSLQERNYTRTIAFDSSGNVRTVSEAWRETRRGKLGVGEYRGRTLSVKNFKDTTTQVNRSHVVSHEKTTATNDSRPVQGTEWLWVIIGGFAVLAVLVYFILRNS